MDGTESEPIASEAVRIASGATLVTGLSFVDTDARAGYVSGVIRWNGLADESSITGYVAYFTNEAGQRIGEAIGHAARGAAQQVALSKLAIPSDAVNIAVYVKDSDGVTAAGTTVPVRDRSSVEEVRQELKSYLFPQVAEVKINHIMSAMSNKTDMNGDGVFDKEDARLILSLIGMTS
jgi:hypothetical protein